jgi:hypothetical protein
MQIGTTQSQSLFASVDLTRTRVEDSRGSMVSTQIEGHMSLLRTEGDVVKITQIDFSFAQTVLRDSLQKRLDSAIEAAGVELDSSELLAGTVDTSPEATAQRIADFALGFFETVKANNPDKSPTIQLDDFVGLIKGAVEEGFELARGILNDIGQIAAPVEADINKTFELVMERIAAFAEQQRQQIAEQEADSGDELIV